MIPEVSVIIPVFNRENLIIETLKSVKNQIFSNWECCIVDDGSTDNSIKNIQSFIQRDERFKLIRRSLESKKGAASCRNIGLQNTSAKFIQFLDSDDIISENKIRNQLNLLKESDEFSISTCVWGRFGKGLPDNLFLKQSSYSNYTNSEDFLNSLKGSKGYFPPHAYLMQRKLIEKVGPWNENLSLNDDGEFMMRIIANTTEIKCALESIAWYRLPEKNNLSNYGNIEAVNSAILSWKLVDNSLKIRFKKKRIEYVEWAKGRLFINVKKSFPELIEFHKPFFTEQIRHTRRQNSLYSRVIRKISQKF
tara:strand:+ start:1606 stop:2526 length:921 start_codon:yes stop_codon:yes gene_type:complete